MEILSITVKEVLRIFTEMGCSHGSEDDDDTSCQQTPDHVKGFTAQFTHLELANTIEGPSSNVKLKTEKIEDSQASDTNAFAAIPDVKLYFNVTNEEPDKSGCDPLTRDPLASVKNEIKISPENFLGLPELPTMSIKPEEGKSSAFGVQNCAPLVKTEDIKDEQVVQDELVCGPHIPTECKGYPGYSAGSAVVGSYDCTDDAGNVDVRQGKARGKKKHFPLNSSERKMKYSSRFSYTSTWKNQHSSFTSNNVTGKINHLTSSATSTEKNNLSCPNTSIAEKTHSSSSSDSTTGNSEHSSTTSKTLKRRTNRPSHTTDTSCPNSSVAKKKHLSRTIDSSTGNINNACFTCGKIYLALEKLTKHEQAHSKQKPFTCTVCQACFSRQNELNRHTRSHFGEHKTKCETCGSSFRDKYNLRRHLRTHSGERPYQCKVCKKKFITKWVLEGHLRRHTKERPYSCHFCEKSFAKKWILTYHIRTHTNERPYTCHHCGNSYIMKSNLLQHIRTHSDVWS